MTINNLKPGDKAAIVGFNGDLQLQARLVEMGLLPGIEIRLVKTAPLSGPVELKVRDYYISIRRKDAGKIQVAPL